jgi:hypothetical protein
MDGDDRMRVLECKTVQQGELNRKRNRRRGAEYTKNCGRSNMRASKRRAWARSGNEEMKRVIVACIMKGATRSAIRGTRARPPALSHCAPIHHPRPHVP